MKLPIVKSLHIEKFTGTAIDIADYLNKNAIIGEYDDGRIYATQRPSIDIFDDASEASLPEKGRGVYRWDKADDTYSIVADKVYKGSLAGVAIATLGSSVGTTGKIYFVEMVNYLVLLDPQNNQGWYINSSTLSTVTEIADLDFPPKQTPALQLTGGGAFLNGRLYVGTTSASIYNSDANTPVTWTAGEFVTAEREADDGVYVDKIIDHIVMFGTRTIEFFYFNPDSTSGTSTLTRRRDIFHNLGLMQGDAAWREGDEIYFIGVYPSGPLEVMRLNNQFQLENISTPELESYITNARLVEDANFFSSGFTSGHRTFYILTFYRVIDGVIEPTISLTYDGISWSPWESRLCSCNNFPLIGWTIRSGSAARSGEGILTNGDLITITDDFIPVDTLLSTAYIESGYIQDGYYVTSGSAGQNIEMIVRTGPYDGDTNYWKFGHTIEIVGDETEAAVNATVKWADGNSSTFNAGRTVDLSTKEKITRLGRFKRRNHEIVFDIVEQYRIEALELELTEGGH